MGMCIYVDDSDNVVGNTAVLGRDLKQRMNFSGWVMSDWDGVFET